MELMHINDQAVWDKFMRDSPYGTLFHSWDYLRIIERNSQYKLYLLGVYLKEEPVCLFPIFTNKPRGITVLFSPPPNVMVPHLGFVMSPIYNGLKQRRKEMYLNEVMDAVEKEIKKLSPDYVYISTSNGFRDVRPFKWNGYDVRLNYSHVINLKEPLDRIWDDFHEDVKLGIQDAVKKQMSIRPTDDVDKYCDMLSDRYKRSGRKLPTITRQYLKDVLAAFPNNVKIDFVYESGEIVDLVAYYQYKTLFGFWPGMSTHGRQSPCFEYIVWNYIQSKKLEGFEMIELMGGSEGAACSKVSKLNARLKYDFSITKKDLKGAIADRAIPHLAQARGCP